MVIKWQESKYMLPQICYGSQMFQKRNGPRVARAELPGTSCPADTSSCFNDSYGELSPEGNQRKDLTPLIDIL